MFTTERLLAIHRTLHGWDGEKPLNIIRIEEPEVKYPLTLTPKSKCRAVVIDGYKFIEQNPKNNSTAGAAARSGTKITWIIPAIASPTTRRWGKIVDNTVEVLPPGA